MGKTKTKKPTRRSTPPSENGPHRPDPRQSQFEELDATPGQILMKTCVGVRVHLSSVSNSRAVSKDQKQAAARALGSNDRGVSVSKKLMDSQLEPVKNLNAVMNQIGQYWKSMSLPYVEPGTRLLKKDQIQEFDKQMQLFRVDLAGAAKSLERRMDEVRKEAKERLGEQLYNEEDYPSDVASRLSVSWDYPNLEPPSYLERLAPDVYKDQLEAVQARFENTVQLAASDFMAEFKTVVDHIIDRTSDVGSGDRKVFRDSMVEHLLESVNRFRNLGKLMDAPEELNRLVNAAEAAIEGRGVNVDAGEIATELRVSKNFRAEVNVKFAELSAALDKHIVDRPRRRIDRKLASVSAKGPVSEPAAED